MLKRLALVIFSCFLCSLPARAYEFSQIEKLFDLLHTEYKGTADWKELSLKSCAALSQFDKNFKLYNSDTKAFLYEKNNLIGVFELPSNNEHFALWKQFISDILQTGMKRSHKILQNLQALENEVLKRMTAGLDYASRIEDTDLTKHQFQYSLSDDILYVQASSFYAGFSDYLKKIITSHPNLVGIVLDFRNNLGGDFSEAIKTADLFLDNTLITFSETSNQPQKYYTASVGDILTGRPIIILTNELTASSAEIVTAALNEQSRATIIGTNTFGKDSIQRLYKLGEKTLFLTYGTFYTPSGKRIGESGISPQICTGINHSCEISDKTSPYKDIRLAFDLIKKNLS